MQCNADYAIQYLKLRANNIFYFVNIDVIFIVDV